MRTLASVRRGLAWRCVGGAHALPAAAAAGVALVLLLTGCGASLAASSNGGVAQQDADAPLTRWRQADRPGLPKLSGRTLDGGRLDVAAWRGQVLVVNTWGSWCGPCRKEAPALARVFNETNGAGVRFVGINVRDNDAAARAFTRELHIGYPSLVDDDAQLMLALARTIPISAVPATVVVDRQGRIAARVIGAVTYATLHGLVADTLAEGRTP